MIDLNAHFPEDLANILRENFTEEQLEVLVREMKCKVCGERHFLRKNGVPPNRFLCHNPEHGFTAKGRKIRPSLTIKNDIFDSLTKDVFWKYADIINDFYHQQDKNCTRKRMFRKKVQKHEEQQSSQVLTLVASDATNVSDDNPESHFEPEQENHNDYGEYAQYIPKVDPYFVRSGSNYSIIEKIVRSNSFFPLYVYGLSGIGKTMQIEQACAKNGKPFFRMQITRDVTNEDLIGSYSLKNGNTEWVDGPVLKAYRSGGILLLDEVDLNPSLMVLQVVLENKPFFVQQTGELVYPKTGFNVFATGNTKGDGSDNRFVGASVLNDAFLERFVAIVEQSMPKDEDEKRIIDKYIELEDIKLDENIYGVFLKWISMIRKSYAEGNVDVYISSRRVQYILKMYKFTGKFSNSLKFAISRYSDTQKNAILGLWSAIYKEIN